MLSMRQKCFTKPSGLQKNILLPNRQMMVSVRALRQRHPRQWHSLRQSSTLDFFFRNAKQVCGCYIVHCVTARFPIFYSEAIPQFFPPFALWQGNGIFPNKICCKIITQTENQSNNSVCLFQAKTICASASDVNEWSLVFFFVIDRCTMCWLAVPAAHTHPDQCQCFVHISVSGRPNIHWPAFGWIPFSRREHAHIQTSPRAFCTGNGHHLSVSFTGRINRGRIRCIVGKINLLRSHLPSILLFWILFLSGVHCDWQAYHQVGSPVFVFNLRLPRRILNMEHEHRKSSADETSDTTTCHAQAMWIYRIRNLYFMPRFAFRSLDNCIQLVWPIVQFRFLSVLFHSKREIHIFFFKFRINCGHSKISGMRILYENSGCRVWMENFECLNPSK